MEQTHVEGVELAVLEPRVDRDRAVEVVRNGQAVVGHTRATGRDLVVVEGNEDVLGVAPVDAVAVAIEHIGVDEVRPGIDAAVGAAPTALADHPAVRGRRDFQPDLVGVGRALGEGVADGEGPQHDFDEVLAAGRQGRNARTHRRSERCVDGAALANAEDVHPQRALEERPVGPVHGVGKPEQVGQRGVGRREVVAVNGQRAARVVALRREVVGLEERHVAAVAVLLGLGRVVEAGHAVSRDPAQQEGVVVVLATQPAVAVERHGQVHLVACAAELGALVQRFEERLLVQSGLGLDQEAVDPAGDRVP